MDDNEIIEALDKGKNLATADLAAFDVKSSRDGGCIPYLEFDEPWRSENDDLRMIRGDENVGAVHVIKLSLGTFVLLCVM